MGMESTKGQLNGRVALVTGASRGLGRAIALAFGAAGASVALTARTQPALASVAAQLEERGTAALVVPADLGHEADIAPVAEKTLERFGRIDILVNYAGIVHPRVDCGFT